MHYRAEDVHCRAFLEPKAQRNHIDCLIVFLRFMELEWFEVVWNGIGLIKDDGTGDGADINGNYLSGMA